ncbi:hypothetical protein HK405_010291, partial [Cladochytrium tenue]
FQSANQQQPVLANTALNLRGLTKEELNTLRRFRFVPFQASSQIGASSGSGLPPAADSPEDGAQRLAEEIPLTAIVTDGSGTNVNGGDTSQAAGASQLPHIPLPQPQAATLSANGAIDVTNGGEGPSVVVMRPTAAKSNSDQTDDLNDSGDDDDDDDDDDDFDHEPQAGDATVPEEPLPAGASPKCAICFRSYRPGQLVRELACGHCFHSRCVDPWLATPDVIRAADAATRYSHVPLPERGGEHVAHRTCPLCVREAVRPEDRAPEADAAEAAARADDELLRRVLEESRAEEARRRQQQPRPRRTAWRGASRRDPADAVGGEPVPAPAVGSRIFRWRRRVAAAEAGADGNGGAEAARGGLFGRAVSMRGTRGRGRRTSGGVVGDADAPTAGTQVAVVAEAAPAVARRGAAPIDVEANVDEDDPDADAAAGSMPRPTEASDGAGHDDGDGGEDGAPASPRPRGGVVRL